MRDREIHLEMLLDRCVLDGEGKSVGRIEEARVEKRGEHWVITEFHLGRRAFLERLCVRDLAFLFLGRFGAHKLPAGYVVPWDKLDLSDPEQPRLLCRKEDLRGVQESLAEAEK
jgi:hypothetical protein